MARYGVAGVSLCVQVSRSAATSFSSWPGGVGGWGLLLITGCCPAGVTSAGMGKPLVAGLLIKITLHHPGAFSAPPRRWL